MPPTGRNWPRCGSDAREGRLTLEEAILDFEALFRIPGSPLPDPL